MSYVNTARIDVTMLSARASSSSPRARASRRACCSTRRRGGFRTAWPTRAATVGRYLTDSTGLSASAGTSRKWSTACPHNEDGTGGAHLYMPWWCDNKKLDFPRGYHIELGGGKRRARLRVHGRHPALQRRRRLRQVAQGRLPPLLRLDGQLRRPRRDDPERATPTARSIRASSTPTASRCCGSTPGSRTTKSTRPDTCRRPSARSSTRWAARRCRRCRRARRLRPRTGRPDHPRGRHHADGQRSGDIGAERDIARRTM